MMYKKYLGFFLLVLQCIFASFSLADTSSSIEANQDRLLLIPSVSSAKTGVLIRQLREFSGKNYILNGVYGGVMFLDDADQKEKNLFSLQDYHKQVCVRLNNNRRHAKLTDLRKDTYKIRRRVICRSDIRVYKQEVPNDPLMSQLWGMGGGYGINALPAWGYSIGSRDVVVGVVDSGVDYNHPDLRDNIWRNPYEVAGNGIDDDRNGYVDDVYGWDFYHNDNYPIGNDPHGTHVAGTIGAAGNNGVGVVGVNWRVSMIPLKIFSDNGGGSLSASIQAFDYVTKMYDKGVNIVATNNSWGTTVNLSNIASYLLYFERSVQNHEDRQILMVAAAGNVSSAERQVNPALLNLELSPMYPASLPHDNIISVASVDSNGNISEFSKYGNVSVDIAAPGSAILSTMLGGQYGTLSGTSMAAPHVAGAIALIAAYDQSLTTYEIADRLMLYGTNVNALAGKVKSGKTLNLLAALTENRIASVTPVPTRGPAKTPVNTSPSTDPTPVPKAKYFLGGKISSKVYAASKLSGMFEVRVNGEGHKYSLALDKSGRWGATFESGNYTVNIVAKKRSKIRGESKQKVNLNKNKTRLNFTVGSNLTFKRVG